jgi:Domain of unknown function (DUF4307)
MTPTETPPPVFPPGRYGRRRDPAYQHRRRWVTYLVAAMVIVAGVAIAVKLYRQYAQSPYQVTIIGVQDLSESGVTVTFEVTTPPGQGATCTVRAHTRDGELVGEAQVDVPPGAAGQTVSRVTYSLVTTKKPITGEVPGCGPSR